MTSERPLILITNDDDVWAKDVGELIECLKDLGGLVAPAPDGPRSGVGSAIISLVPIRYTLSKEEEGLTIYSCTGTTADCVKLAIDEVMERKSDLLAFDINYGGNMAICVNYSETMSVTAKGCILNVLLMGVFLPSYAASADFSERYRPGRMLAHRVLGEDLPHGTYLNLNMLKLSRVKGLKVRR